MEVSRIKVITAGKYTPLIWNHQNIKLSLSFFNSQNGILITRLGNNRKKAADGGLFDEAKKDFVLYTFNDRCCDISKRRCYS